MTTLDIINKLYGVSTYEENNPLNTSVQTHPTQILANNPGALQLTIINTGASDLMLWNDETVSSTNGILIAANGGSYEIDFTRFMLMPTYSWWAVGVGGTTTVSAKRQAILGG